MVALLYADKIKEGEVTFKEVPKLWKQKVRDILIERGEEDKIIE